MLRSMSGLKSDRSFRHHSHSTSNTAVRCQAYRATDPHAALLNPRQLNASAASFPCLLTSPFLHILLREPADCWLKSSSTRLPARLLTFLAEALEINPTFHKALLWCLPNHQASPLIRDYKQGHATGASTAGEETRLSEPSTQVCNEGDVAASDLCWVVAI